MFEYTQWNTISRCLRIWLLVKKEKFIIGWMEFTLAGSSSFDFKVISLFPSPSSKSYEAESKTK